MTGATVIVVSTGGPFDQFKDAVVIPSLAEIISMDRIIFPNFIGIDVFFLV